MPDGLTLENDLLAATFATYSNPGAYALLLGAGVSVPSGIPTAWGVLTELCARAAGLTGQSPDDPAAWYTATYGTEPTYEGVLEHVAPTQIERQRLLRGFFEQSPDDVDAGRKQPTLAHRSIARLVRAGVVKVIVTLNFDHLMEQALREAGIEPTVIATPSDATGMAPLHTLECCVIHLHGDYLNPTSMRNTVAELESYAPATQSLLHRVLEDYGLIIAGWSATYDPVLRGAIAVHYTGRFTMTWLEPGTPSPVATNLRTLKRGIHVPRTADVGFGVLADGVDALTTRRARHPLSIPVAVETAKRELSGRPVAIGLHDRLRQELGTLNALPEFHLDDYQHDPGYEALLGRVEDASRMPAALIATLAYWGNDTTDKWWVDELPRFATRVDGAGMVKLLDLRVVAGSALFYAAGVAAVAAQRFDLLRRLFTLRRPATVNGELGTFAATLDTETGYENAEQILTRLFDLLEPLLRDTLTLGRDPLEDAWQQFEVLRLAWAAVHTDEFPTIRDAFHLAERTWRASATAYEEARKRSTTDGAVALPARSTAWEQRGRVLGQLSRLTYPGRPHVLTIDNRDDARRHSPTAARLLQDLSAAPLTHPLITSGVFSGIDDATAALHGISAALGVIASDLAYERVSERVGTIPSQLWLDSGLTPGETRHPNTLNT